MIYTSIESSQSSPINVNQTSNIYVNLEKKTLKITQSFTTFCCWKLKVYLYLYCPWKSSVFCTSSISDVGQNIVDWWIIFDGLNSTLVSLHLDMCLLIIDAVCVMTTSIRTSFWSWLHLLPSPDNHSGEERGLIYVENVPV